MCAVWWFLNYFAVNGDEQIISHLDQLYDGNFYNNVEMSYEKDFDKLLAQNFSIIIDILIITKQKQRQSLLFQQLLIIIKQYKNNCWL